MNLKSILVVTDLSARESVAVQRASQLAAAHRASIRLLLLPGRGEPVPPAAATRLAETARELETGLGLRVRTAHVKSGRLEDLVTEARGADLVVLPHRHERSTAAFFRGQPVLRLLRQAGRPVLVVRQARGERYRRMLVAVDFSPESAALVRLAGSFEADAEVEIFHAVSTLGEARLRSAEAPEQAVRAYREKCLQHARERIVSLGAAFDARANPVRTSIGRGDPGRETVLRQEHSGADLVVLGKSRSSAWEDFFLGSAAHRVLSWGSSDVLVVPEALLASASHAPRRVARRQASRLALPLRPPERRA